MCRNETWAHAADYSNLILDHPPQPVLHDAQGGVLWINGAQSDGEGVGCMFTSKV